MRKRARGDVKDWQIQGTWATPPDGFCRLAVGRLEAGVSCGGLRHEPPCARFAEHRFAVVKYDRSRMQHRAKPSCVGEERGAGLKIRAIIDDVGGYRIALSTDRARNLNFITGGYGVGKTRMFGKIKARLQNEEAENGIGLDLTEECGLDADLVFVSDIWRTRGALFKNREFPRGQLRGIVQSANRMLSTVGGVFESEDSLLKSSDGRIPAPRGLAAGPSAVSTFGRSGIRQEAHHARPARPNRRLPAANPPVLRCGLWRCWPETSTRC